MLTQRTNCSSSVTHFRDDRFGQLISSEDAEGNITRREWNLAGQLTAWRDPLESDVLWTYNRLGATAETRFLRQGFRLLQKQQQNGQCQTYVYDPNEAYNPLARVDHLAEDKQGDVYWFSTDLNGAPMDITEQGLLRWSGHYGSFGEVARQTEGFHRLAQQTALAHQPLPMPGSTLTVKRDCTIICSAITPRRLGGLRCRTR